MNIKLNNNSGIPIYEQIKDQIKEYVASGTLNSKDPLPSIRALSNQIGISVMTVKKAYDELLDEGVIITIPGKGSYINLDSVKIIRESMIDKIELLLGEAIDIAKSLNITKEELLKHYLKLEQTKRGN